jgi:hypothetical protein
VELELRTRGPTPQRDTIDAPVQSKLWSQGRDLSVRPQRMNSRIPRAQACIALLMRSSRPNPLRERWALQMPLNLGIY